MPNVLGYVGPLEIVETFDGVRRTECLLLGDSGSGGWIELTRDEVVQLEGYLSGWLYRTGWRDVRRKRKVRPGQ